MTWSLKQLGIPKMWEKTKGENINVAVLDTGVHGKHPALDGRERDSLSSIRCATASRQISRCRPAWHSRMRHNWRRQDGRWRFDWRRARCEPIRRRRISGKLHNGTLVEGISWAVEQGADIISMSLGFDYYEPKFAELFKMLIEQFGVLPVAAIGNEYYGNSLPGIPVQRDADAVRNCENSNVGSAASVNCCLMLGCSLSPEDEMTI